MRSDKLREWYDKNHHEKKVIKSMSSAGNADDKKEGEVYKLIKEISDNGFFKMSGYLLKVLSDEQKPPYFLGCPLCKRKLSQSLSCDYCLHSFSESEVRVTYMFAAKFQDFSDSIYLQFIGDSCEPLIGMPAAALRKEEARNEIIGSVSYNQVGLVVKKSKDSEERDKF